MKLSCRPHTLNSYKAFLKNKNKSGKTLLHFLQNVWKKKFLYSITWPLTSNFHHPVKKILLPAKFHFDPLWTNFCNMLFFSFKKELNGQNHSSADSHDHIKIPLTARFPISPIGREHGGGLKCCWKISVKEFICYKGVSLFNGEVLLFS